MFKGSPARLVAMLLATALVCAACSSTLFSPETPAQPAVSPDASGSDVVGGDENADTAAAATGTTYYVAPSGNNSSPGTEAAPFRTIQQAIGAAQPGDTIIVTAGTYNAAYAEGTYGHAEWNVNRGDGRGGISGTADARITLKAEHAATEVLASQRTILEGDGTGFGLYLADFDYITIDGFEITNFEIGIGLQGQSSNLILRRNILRSNTSVGIECASCSDNRFEYNAFLDPGPTYPDLDDAIQDYGLNFYQGSANNTVVYNYFFGKHNQALSWKRKAGPGYAAYNTFEGFMYTAVYLGQNDDEADGGDMTSHDITVEYNVFRDSVDADTGVYYRAKSPVVVRNVQNAIVRSNYIENTVAPAVSVAPCEGGYYCETVAGRRPVGATIYGNTIVNGKVDDSGVDEAITPPAFRVIGRGYTADTISVYNNTVYNMNKAIDIQGTPSNVSQRETPAPPDVAITNNNLINVGAGVDGELSTTTFAYNNWYDLNDPSVDNRQDTTDSHLAPELIGPLTAFDPANTLGPSITFRPDFSSMRRYSIMSTSPLIDAGSDVGLPFDGTAPDIGANEFTPPIISGRQEGKPFPAGDGIPFGWAACDNMQHCRDDGFTLIHRSYDGDITGAEAAQWAQDAVNLGIEKNFVNTTPFDLMRNNLLTQQYSLWKQWFQDAANTVPPGTIAGYYLPDEPEPSMGEYDKVNEIVRALKDVDPNALAILYDGGVNPNTLTEILGEVGPGIDVLLDGGYPLHHPEYGGHGWVYARLREIEDTVHSYGKTIWMVTEGFDEACSIDDAKQRAKSHMALGILGGAQGVMTYAYIYSVDTPCYTAHLEFKSIFEQLWPWIKAGNKTELPVTVTAGPAESPVYNLSHATSYTSVAAWLFTDDDGRLMLGTANLLDDAAVEATISGMPAGTWRVLGENRSVAVSGSGTLSDRWVPLGYHFYLFGDATPGIPSPTPAVTSTSGPSPTATHTATPGPSPTPTQTPFTDDVQTVKIAVAGPLDDADANEEGLDAEADDINVPSWSRGFFRFKVEIPQGATIRTAYLKVRTLSEWTGTATARIRVLNTSNASAFTTNPYDFPTYGEIVWNTGHVAENTWTRSADIGTLLQQFIDNPAYNSGNHVGLVWDPTLDSSDRSIWAYDGGHPPILVITYETRTRAFLPAITSQ